MSLAKKVLHMKHHKECENGGGASSWNDLTDKPFGEALVEKEYIFERGNVTKLNGTNGYILTCDAFDGNGLVAGQKYAIYYAQYFKGDSTVWAEYASVNNEDFIAEIDENGNVYLGSSNLNGSYPFYFSSEVCAVNYIWVNQFTYAQAVKLVGAFGGIKKLDEKYLPDEVFAQSDWSQSDTTASDYIKNKPFGDEIIATDISGSVYTITGFNSATFTVTHDPLPLEKGQEWKVQNDRGNFLTAYVQEDENGEPYLGTPTVNDLPFYIRTTETTLNSSYWWQYQTTNLTLTCTSGVVSTTVVKQLPQKYIPSMPITYINENGDMTQEEFLSLDRGIYYAKSDIPFTYDNNGFPIYGLLIKEEYYFHFIDCGQVLEFDLDTKEIIWIGSANGFGGAEVDQYTREVMFNYNQGSYDCTDTFDSIMTAMNEGCRMVIGRLNYPVQIDSDSPYVRYYTLATFDGDMITFSFNCQNQWIKFELIYGQNDMKVYTGAFESEIIINSSTEGSTKKFKITVDDSGTISATEVTE